MAAARHILQRNPTAFSPKIQEDGNDTRLAPTPTGEAVRLEHTLPLLRSNDTCCSNSRTSVDAIARRAAA